MKARRPRRAAGRDSEGAAALELRHLRALVALVDHGSMTAAAQALGVSQSTVSEGVAALERALGTPLVARRRGTHDSALTASGRALLPHARRVLALLEDARAAVATAARDARARVELIANESVSTYLLPPALAALRREWPNTRFIVAVGTCPVVRAGIADGRYDLGVLLEAEPGPGVDSAPTAGRRLAGAELRLFCAPAHPLARGAQRAAPRQRLAAYTVYASDATGDFHALLAQYFCGDGIAGPRLEPAGSVEAVKRSVAANPLALGVLPDYAVAEEIALRSLVPLAVRPSLPRLRLEALLPEAMPPHPAVLELVNRLRQGLAR